MIPKHGRIIERIGSKVIREMPSSVMGEWKGMNRSSAIKLHFKPLPPKNDNWVDSSRPYQTGKHEDEEQYLEQFKHYSYKKAHHYAENNENKPKSWVVKHFGSNKHET